MPGSQAAPPSPNELDVLLAGKVELQLKAAAADAAAADAAASLGLGAAGAARGRLLRRQEVGCLLLEQLPGSCRVACHEQLAQARTQWQRGQGGGIAARAAGGLVGCRWRVQRWRPTIAPCGPAKKTASGQSMGQTRQRLHSV